MKFEEFNLSEDVLKGIHDAGFTECTPVQAETLKRTLQGRDVTVQSQTGTGKTAAYLTTIFELKATSERFRDRPALVVAPTRELAVQIQHDAEILGGHLGFSIGCFYGGAGYVDQEHKLEQGVDIIIGTPGRLLDFSSSRKLDLSKVGFVVIDEADRLFDMGFYPDIQRIFRKTGPREERLTLLFSATLSQSVLNISWKFMNDPAEIEIEPEHITVQSIEQRLYHVAKDEKFSLLLGVLGCEDPAGALIFCNTRRGCTNISDRLRDNGYDSEYLIGDLPQKKRLRIIDSFKAGKVRILVATDVAARGLHIEDLPLVVNYDLPEDAENYVHRIGRTARVGKSGKAISLACERFVYGLEAIEDYIGMKIPSESVTDELLVPDRSRRRVYEREMRADQRDSRSSRRGSRRGQGARRPSAEHAQAPGSPSHGRRDEDRPRGRSEHGASRRPRHERDGHTERRVPADASLEERLRRYREKYGEEFEPVERPARETSGSESAQEQDSTKGRSRSGRGGRRRRRERSGERQTANAPLGGETAKTAGSGGDRSKRATTADAAQAAKASKTAKSSQATNPPQARPGAGSDEHLDDRQRRFGPRSGPRAGGLWGRLRRLLSGDSAE